MKSQAPARNRRVGRVRQATGGRTNRACRLLVPYPSEGTRSHHGKHPQARGQAASGRSAPRIPAQPQGSAKSQQEGRPYQPDRNQPGPEQPAQSRARRSPARIIGAPAVAIRHSRGTSGNTESLRNNPEQRPVSIRGPECRASRGFFSRPAWILRVSGLAAIFSHWRPAENRSLQLVDSGRWIAYKSNGS